MSEIFATTDRLILRDFRPADLPPYIALSADPEVMRYLGGPRSAEHCEGELAAISREYAATGIGMLAVERQADGVFLGICGLSHEQWYPDDLQIGWRFFQPYWGHGYASEAALVWRDFAFGRGSASDLDLRCPQYAQPQGHAAARDAPRPHRDAVGRS